MQNRILTEAEVYKSVGNISLKQIPFRQIGFNKLFILSDVLNYLEMLMPYNPFEPIEIKDGFYIVESKMNNEN